MATQSSTHATQVLHRFRQDHPDISFIRLQWQDYSGVLRARVLVIEYVISLVAEGKQFKASPYAIECGVDNYVLPTTSHNGMHWLVPDWSSLRATASPGNAAVMCALNYTIPGSPAHDHLCPRQALLRVLRQAQEAWKLDFLVGFEVEFVVMKSSTSSTTPHRQSAGLGHYAVSGLRDPCYQYVEQCMHKLRDRGVIVHALHTEGIRGQYEIVLGPLPPVQAVDQLILVHHHLKDTFSRHDYKVTMSPKPISSDPLANGQHMHLSLQPTCPSQEESFLAGILKRLPSLCSFCLPQQISYERLGPYFAGDAVCWGTESRLVPIRKIKPGHWELRCIDVTANMYITLAAILSAGLLGLAGKEPLTWPDVGDPKHEAQSRGEPLPQSLEDSLAVLAADADCLATMIGRPMIDHYIDMKRFEISRLKEMDTQAVRELLIEIF